MSITQNHLTIKKDFPIFATNPQLIYLDNSATSQKPKQMIQAISNYYSTSNSNIGRGVYKLAEQSQRLFDFSRKNIADFIGSNSDDIVFTSSCTESLNLAAYTIGQNLTAGDKVVLSIFEHHANILPWQRLAKEKGIDLVFIKDTRSLLYPEQLSDDFWDNVKVISLAQVSNVTGLIIPIEKWISCAKKHNITTVIDAAQSICCMPIKIDTLDCDFLAFSSHKTFGPTGVGILYINPKYSHNPTINHSPLLLGGGIIQDVLENDFFLLDENVKYEAGSPNVANILGLSASLDYLTENNWHNLLKYTHELGDYLYSAIQDHPHLHLVVDRFALTPPEEKEIGNIDTATLIKHHISKHIISFYIDGIHPHDIGSFLSTKNIAVRVGKHCTHPLHNHLKLNSSVRASLAFYNTKKDIDLLINGLNDCINFFKGE